MTTSNYFHFYSSIFISVGVSSISGSIDEIGNIYAPPLRLYDNYLTAFHRVVEVCLIELSTRVSADIPQNDDFLLNVITWEQSLRRELTSQLWKQNPSELIGDWEFVDIKGSGGLAAIMAGQTDNSNNNGAAASDNNASIGGGEVLYCPLLSCPVLIYHCNCSICSLQHFKRFPYFS